MKEMLITLLFPRRCPVCGEIVPGISGVRGGALPPLENLICPECIDSLSPVRQPVCMRCGKEVTGSRTEYCPDCMRHPRSFDGGAALFHYNEAARRSMAAVKYKNRREYLDFYSQAMVSRYGKWLSHIRPDALVPVPVHPARRRKRGFNQAEELAERISLLTGIPVRADLLIRIRKTLPQKELNPAERLNNLRLAFAVSDFYKIHPDQLPERVVLADDIYTTGSTMEACTRVLKEAGVKQVYVMSVCIGTGR